jgi:hypothetical protein
MLSLLPLDVVTVIPINQENIQENIGFAKLHLLVLPEYGVHW